MVRGEWLERQGIPQVNHMEKRRQIMISVITPIRNTKKQVDF